MNRKTWLFLVLIFIFAFAIRFWAVWPANTILGFDQARDLFDSVKIMNGDLRIIGPTAGNNPGLHHGIAFLYFLIPPLLLSRNPIAAVLWNSFFNAASCFVLFFLAKSLFKSTKAGLVAAILTASSYYYVQFSGWLSNPTVTLFTVPVFFLGLWEYSQRKKWGLPLASLFLGLSIQFELFFIYLIPTGLILWLVLKPKFPNFKICIYSLLAITFSLSSMILTEIKFQFAGVKNLLWAGELTGGVQRTTFIKQFMEKFFSAFSSTLLPNFPNLGIVIAVSIILILIFKRQWFLLIYLFSPALMLVLGYHNAPWFLIGLPPAIILATSFGLSKIKSNLLLGFCLLPVIFFNLTANKNGQVLLEPDKAAILSKQIAAMEYSYQKAAGEPFAIDTVTNPLYTNAVWAWNYDWYGKKYDYKPGWLGGDQLPPYDTLPKATGKEKYFFLIIDTTPRIPPIYTQNATVNLAKRATLIEEKDFDGIKVMMWKNNNQKTNSKSTKSK